MYRRNQILIVAILFACLCTGLPLGRARADEGTTSFDRDIAPLLARRCLGCHNPSEKKGGLDLTSEQSAALGGDSGRVIEAGDVDSSLLWQRIDAEEMPPKKPLPAEEKARIKNWLAAGAAWGTSPIDRFQFTTDNRAGYDWWSLQPLPGPSGPAPVDGPAANPIDSFVSAKLVEHGLRRSPEADRRTLIRRLSFDLLGLPPTPAEVAAFQADTSANAYERLVDRLLASPQYGVHWARHWLDVARFGESDGFEFDRLRPNAWPYRDWVVDSLNQDLPYDEFCRLQIAGDALRPNDPQAITATGFLVCGAFDGLIPAGDAMRLIMREDEMEDLVGTISQTFLGLTVNCARCHDHKFDPIRQADYYRLASSLAGIKRGDRDLPVVPPPDADALRQQLAAVQAALQAIDEPLRAAILAERAAAATQPATQPAAAPLVSPQPIAQWDFTQGPRDQIGSLDVTLVGAAQLTPEGLALDGKTAYGQTGLLDRPLRAKTLAAWVALANTSQRGGAPLSVQTPDGNEFDAIVFGETEPGRWIVGSAGFRRTQPVQGSDETSSSSTPIHIAITYLADGTITVYRNGEPYGRAYQVAEPHEFAAGRTQVVFGLRHLPVSDGKLLAGTVRQASLYDRALTAAEIAATAGVVYRAVTETDLLARLTSEQQATRSRLLDQRQSIAARLNLQPPKVFAVTPQAAPVIHRLDRGNPATPREPVAPGGVHSLAASSPDFNLPADAPDAERRIALARWITGPQNPLFARVMANRVWYYHFGAGLIETPSDFGFNGGHPSHPDLLDWLAGEFARSGFRLKSLHRAIMTSATYRQCSGANAAAARIDAGDRLLWRFPPRRLQAETVRDAVLLVAGQLNWQLGGAGFQDFEIQNQNNTTAYLPRDPQGADYNRRSLYRTWARGARNPLLDTFDCPDPSVTSPLRGVTTTPLQALSLLNNSFVLRMADHFAARVAAEAGPRVEDQVHRAFELAFNRAPSDAERDRVEPFVAQYGLPALCRALINANEFLYAE